MEINGLSENIHHSKIKRARKMTLDERLTAGATLFAEQLLLVREMVVGLHPDWTEAEVDAEMRRRQAVIRKSNEKEFYSHSQPTCQDLRRS